MAAAHTTALHAARPASSLQISVIPAPSVTTARIASARNVSGRNWVTTVTAPGRASSGKNTPDRNIIGIETKFVTGAATSSVRATPEIARPIVTNRMPPNTASAITSSQETTSPSPTARSNRTIPDSRRISV